MNDYMIRFSDGLALHVEASSVEGARNRAYNVNRSGVIVNIDKV